MCFCDDRAGVRLCLLLAIAVCSEVKICSSVLFLSLYYLLVSLETPSLGSEVSNFFSYNPMLLYRSPVNVVGGRKGGEKHAIVLCEVSVLVSMQIGLTKENRKSG